MISVETYTLGWFEVHNYLIWDDETHEAVLIDAGKNPTEIIDFIRAHQLNLSHLLQTHAHIDHVEGHVAIKEAFPEVKTYLHPDDNFWLEHLDKQAMLFQMEAPARPIIDHPVQAGDIFQFKNFQLRARHAPGHAPGSICYVAPEINSVFVGDVLFAGSIGRTDLPQGNFDTLMQSIQTQLLTLPEEMTVYSGHGPTTTIGQEKRYNPFVVNQAKTL